MDEDKLSRAEERAKSSGLRDAGLWIVLIGSSITVAAIYIRPLGDIFLAAHVSPLWISAPLILIGSAVAVWGWLKSR
jgi:hypothetical protein